MKDRYLFKAKRLDNGEWVEGYYIHDGVTDKSFIHQKDCELNESDKVGEEGCLRLFAFEIDSDTLCQCTGLIDKNRNKIWESDICKIRFELPDEPLNGLYEYHNCKIFWDEERLKYVYGDKENTWDDLGECLAEDLEVIGNIFNNPELLEVENEIN